MKIPSKLSSNLIKSKISKLSGDQKKIIKDSANTDLNNLVSIDLKKILNTKSKKSFSARFINYTEPYEISGKIYTLFYTEIDHNLNIGDRVFIIGGNYDSDTIIQNNKFDKKADGYIVQYVDRTKIVLDIEYNADLTWNSDDYDDYIKVYVASSQEEFDYFCQNFSNRGISQIIGSSSTPVTSNRFSYVPSQNTIYGTIGTFSTNTFLYINGTFSTNGNYGILGFSSSGTTYLTYSNSFLMLNGIVSGYLTDITDDVIYGTYSKYLAGGLLLDMGVTSSQIVTNNGKLKIINDSFEIDNILFKKDFIYQFDSTWKVDRSHMPSFITEQNFRYGKFRKGEYNQGLYGTNIKEIEYDGSEIDFNLGTVINTQWKNGDIKRGDGNSLSYITILDDFGVPYIRSNSNNNAGFGYNYVYNSTIKKSNIVNGNFIDSIVGSFSSENTVYKKISSESITYSVISSGGIYVNSDILFSNISNSTILNSSIANSEIQSSKSKNSEFEKSYFQKSKYTSDKIIKIEKYQEDDVYWYDEATMKFFKVHKFYLSENNFKKLSSLENFYFDGINLKGGTKRDIFNFFDDKFTIGSYRYSFDFIDSSNFIFEKVDKKIIVQLSTKEDNKNSFTGTFSNLSLIDENESYSLPSLDIIVEDIQTGFSGVITSYIDLSEPTYFAILPYSALGAFNVKFIDNSTVGTTLFFGSDGYDIATYLNSLLVGTWYYDEPTGQLISPSSSTIKEIFIAQGFSGTTCSVIQNVDPIIDISNSYIVDSDFKSGIFKDSEWITGNYINYNKDNSINTNSSGYYLTSSVATSSGNPIVTLTIRDEYRYLLFDEGDVVFTNGLYYDTSLSGGSNLVKLSSTYTVDSYTYSTNRSINLIDINGTSSVIFNVPSFSNQSYLITKNAENNYNYLHPVKFENSKIKSGIFRRAYFEGCEIYSDQFDNLDKSPTNFNNYRNLAISDLILNDNSNTIKSGLIRHSSIIGGSDIWKNAILLNSIWNGDSFTHSNSATGSSITSLSNISFQNGIVKESKWVNGIFENGQFFRNKSNKVGTSSVFSNQIKDHYSKNFETRYSWLNGVFKNGIFELSNWEDGTFLNGEFYNSTFISGTANSGTFGRKNVPPSLTKILSGSFSNTIVNNAEFITQNPKGGFTSSKSIDWYSGIFNSGIFGSMIDSFSYSQSGLNYAINSTWHDGEFNGGEFTNNSVWKKGKFNGGKFTSHYGYPSIPNASYSTMTQSFFAWQGGEFNGGEFGNFSIGTNSTWYNGEFNGGIFSGRYWNNGVFSKGHFFGSATISTTLYNIPKFVAGFSSDFYGLWNNGFVTEIKDDFIKDKKFFTKIEREFSKKKKRSNVEINNALWKSGTFSHNDALMSGSVWINGEFKKGTFYKSSFNPYVNYITDGDFTSLETWDFNFSDDDGIGSQIDPISGNLVWEGTSSTTIAYQNSGLEIGETYMMTIKVDYITDAELRFGNWTQPINGNFNSTASWVLLSDSATLIIATGYPGKMEFSGISTTGCYAVIPDILEIGHSYDLTFYTFNAVGSNIEFGSSDFTDGGIISPNANASYSTTIISSNAKNIVSFTAAFPDLTFRISGSGLIDINGIVVTSNEVITATTSAVSQVYSLTFSAIGPDIGIEFLSKGSNSASGATWPTGNASINIIEVIKGSSGFNLTDNCLWENGTFEDSEFFISKWKNGKWISGNGYGMIWQNGIADYMNAFNIHWGGGIWRNGNWNGSPFTAENISLSQSTVSQGFSSDILTNIAIYRESINDPEYQNIFINDAFTASVIGAGELLLDPDIDSEFTSVTFSGTNNAWTWADDYVRWFDSNGFWVLTGSKGSGDGCVTAFSTNSPYFNQSNQVSQKLYAQIGISKDIFTSSTSQYDIEIKYLCYYGPTSSTPSTPPEVIFDVGIGWNGVDSSNGGNKYTISEEITNVNPCQGGGNRGQTNIKTLNYTFVPTIISPIADSQRLYVQKLATSDKSTTLHILKASIIERTVQYDNQYNNSTYSIFGVTPSFSDILQLPSVEFIGGNSNAGSQISIQFGNGIFESGTFSSVWENGVWNEGLRYDRNVIYFDNMRFFSGTTKPVSYQGGVVNKGSNEKSFSMNTTSNLDYNENKISYKQTTWILTIQKTVGTIQFEDGFEMDQTNLNLGNVFKVGDKVSAGNIIGIDINGNRRLLKDYLTVVSVNDDYISLEINVNFPLRKIDKDSTNHLIYVSKNVWLNGAFLNGLFKGIWNNGLFKGYPYITRMIDSQWIDGRLDGGRFRGITLSTTDPTGEDSVKNSGLIQNFVFNDNDSLSTPYEHSYNSWVDVNYYTYSTVTIGKNNISYDEGGLFGTVSIGEYTQTNLYSFPTVDVLSSLSKIRNNFDSNSLKYSLGDKYKEYINYFDDVFAFENYYNSETIVGTRNLTSDGFTWSQGPAFDSKKIFVDGPATASLLSNSDIENESMLEIFFPTAPATSVPFFGTYDVSNTLMKIDNIKSQGLLRQRYSYISFNFEGFYADGIFGSTSNPSTGYIQLNNDGGINNIADIYYLNLLSRRPNVKEYFYNKRNLNLIVANLFGTTPSSISLSNLKLVESDMIPFFQLATESRINQSIASPWQSIAPSIDYSDANFSLVDNIVLSETIFTTVVSSITIGSGGVYSGNTVVYSTGTELPSTQSDSTGPIGGSGVVSGSTSPGSLSGR